MKAWWTFDFTQSRRWARDLQGDQDSYRDARLAEVEVWSVLLAVHPLRLLKLEQPALKFHYAKAANARLRGEGSAEVALKRARDEVGRWIRSDRRVAHRMLDAGEAFGTPIQVGVWIIGPTAGANRQVLAVEC